jgi:hypothetical protein
MQTAGNRTEVGTAEWFRENGRRIRETMAKKARAGERNGPLPLGYKFEQDGLKKKVVFDPEKAPLVRQAFLMAAAGYPIRKIIVEMTAAGLASRHGKPLGPSSMLKVLRNGFYTGTTKDGGTFGRVSPPPLIDFKTFALTQKNLFLKRRRAGHHNEAG